MARRIREHDWAATSLGPITAWPQALRSTVEMLVVHGFPMVLLWGSELVQIYNDGYRLIMADKHPAGLGQPTAECWPEVWHINEPIYERVRGGETVTYEDALYPIARHGPIEDAWFTLTYNPVRGETGDIAGVLVTVYETTARMLGEDRLRTVLDGVAEPFYALDRSWRFLFASRAALELWGKSPEDVVGRSFLEAFPQAFGSTPYDAHRRVMRTRVPERLETISPVINRWIEIDLAPTSQSGLSIAFRDIEVRKQAERRQTFLLRLSDALRPITEPLEAQRTASRILREQLGATRVAYAELEPNEDTAWLLAEDRAEGVGPFPRDHYDWSDFDPAGHAEAKQGRSVARADVQAGDYFTPEQKAMFAAVGFRALINVPLLKDGRLVAFIAVHFERPHGSTAADIALVEETAERTWAAVQRARAEAAVRASEEKYRTLFETMGQGYVEAEIVRDADGRAVDSRLIELNPAFERLTGVPVAAARGRTNREIFPGIEDWCAQTAERVVRSGVPESVDYAVAPLDRYYQVHFYPKAGDRYTAIYEDITDRKRAEKMLRESEERQAFLLKLSDALRPLHDASEIMITAVRMLGQAIGANRAFYGSIDPDGDTAHMFAVFADGVAEAAGTYSLSAFAPKLVPDWQAGQVTITRDVDADPRFTAVERARYASVEARGAVGVPLVKGGRLRALLGVNSAAPRDWAGAEVEVIAETAERTWAAVERASAEAALRVSEERYRTLFENMDEGFVIGEMIRDDDGKPIDFLYQELNPALERQAGWKVAETVGRRLTELVPPDEARYWIDAFSAVLDSGTPQPFEHFIESLGRWFRVNATV